MSCGHRAIVKKDADLNQKDRIGQTPLHQVASNSPTAVVRLLLHKGADP